MAERALQDGWRWVRFDDVVRQVKETTSDPESVGLTRIVGLEHVDSESLPLRRWAELSEMPNGTSFTRIFRNGQVLFGKRRAYQRKVAVPDFDGICSGDLLVFEPSSDELLAEFLPYVVQSVGFFDHALGTSAGSLSPRTKWQELAKYEFALPPVANQQRIVDDLAAARTTLDAYGATHAAAEKLCVALLGSASDRYEMQRLPLASFCREPITYGIVQAGPNLTGGVPYVRVSDMTDNDVLRPECLPRTSPEIAARYQRSACDAGDLVFALRGPIGLTRVVPDELSGVNLTQGTARLAPDTSRVSTECLRWALRAAHVERQYRTVQKGSTFQELSLGALRKIEVDIPHSLEQQAELVAQLGATARLQTMADSAADQLERLVTRLRESSLEGQGNV